MELELIARDGVFSAAGALRAGIDGHALTAAVRQGRCVRLTHGWYALGRPVEPLAVHRLRSIALGRCYAGSALVSHYSQVALLGLPIYSVDLGTVHLSRLADVGAGPGAPGSSGLSRRRPGLVLHRAQPGGCRWAGSQGMARTGVPTAHAVVGAGLVGTPLSALVAADAALARRLISMDDLAVAVSDFEGHRGIAPVRSALRHADSRSESPGESITGHVLRRMGYEIEAQYEVAAEGRSYRADFRIVGTRVLVEFDGAVKYAGDDGSALFAEKRREDALRRAGWVVVRLVWADILAPEVVRRRVAEALSVPGAAA